MQFEIMEIKQLGEGVNRKLSLRLTKQPDNRRTVGGIPDSPFTIHAVVPFVGFEHTYIGQKFSFQSWDEIEKMAKTLENACLDSACPIRGFAPHEFGIGCRLWDSTKPKNKANK